MPARDQSQLQTSQPLFSGKTATVQQRDATRLDSIVSACLVGAVHTNQSGADGHADDAELSKHCNIGGGQLSRTLVRGWSLLHAPLKPKSLQAACSACCSH